MQQSIVTLSKLIDIDPDLNSEIQSIITQIENHVTPQIPRLPATPAIVALSKNKDTRSVQTSSTPNHKPADNASAVVQVSQPVSEPSTSNNIVNNHASSSHNGSLKTSRPREPRKRHIRQLKLHNNCSALILGSSQVNPLNAKAIDSSGSTQLFSYGGATLSELNESLNAVSFSSSNAKSKINNVIVFAGGNDLCQGASVDEVKSRVVALKEKVKTCFPNSYFHLVPLILRRDVDFKVTDACNAALKNISDVHIIPLRHMTPFHFRDRIHLNQEELSWLSKAIQDVLNVKGDPDYPLIRESHQSLFGSPVYPVPGPTGTTIPTLPPPPPMVCSQNFPPLEVLPPGPPTIMNAPATSNFMGVNPWTQPPMPKPPDFLQIQQQLNIITSSLNQMISTFQGVLNQPWSPQAC